MSPLSALRGLRYCFTSLEDRHFTGKNGGHAIKTGLRTALLAHELATRQQKLVRTEAERPGGLMRQGHPPLARAAAAAWYAGRCSVVQCWGGAGRGRAGRHVAAPVLGAAGG